MVLHAGQKFIKLAIFSSLLACMSAFGAPELVEVTADNFFADEVKQISTLTGNVKIKKGSYDTLTSDKVTIYFDAKKQPTKYVATGNAKFKVLVNDKHYDGQGAVLTYTPGAETYTLEGNAHLHETETKKEVFGEQIVVNRTKGTYEVKSAPGGGAGKKPVRLIFQVEDQQK
ncbi:lipopolysaccharide transport periplasmic protein LptA [Campylobacter sp. JMF_08 NE1]|uniref:lipopolysaccharide transport periplasmic protein LptA n=1 Tax=Campylobacter sp. JMF_08 NE1 TaxID=2983821 RepID=UPI003FA4C239